MRGVARGLVPRGSYCYSAQNLVWTSQRRNDLKPANIKAGTGRAAASGPVKLPPMLICLSAVTPGAKGTLQRVGDSCAGPEV